MELDVSFNMQLIDLIEEITKTYHLCININTITNYDEMLEKLDSYRSMREFIEQKAMLLKTHAQVYATQMIHHICSIRGCINTIDTSITKKTPDYIGIVSDMFTLPQLFSIDITKNGQHCTIEDVETVNTLTVQSILNCLRRDKIVLDELKRFVIDLGDNIIRWVNVNVFTFTASFDEYLSTLSSITEEEYKDSSFNLSKIDIANTLKERIEVQTKVLVHLHYNMTSYLNFNEEVTKNPLAIKETFVATESFIELI